MILDNLLCFTGTSNGASGVPASGAHTDLPTTGTQVSSNIIDLGVIGLPPFASGGGARDIGIGDDPMLKLLIEVTTTFTGGTNLQVALQGAPDNGSGAPGAFTTMWIMPAAVVEANLLQGVYLANVDVPRPVAGQPMPRFLQLQYISAGTHGAGAIQGYIVIDRFDQPVGVTGLLSGYVPGVTVPN